MGAVGMDKKVLPACDRASHDDGGVFAPCLSPSVERVRIPVRPRQRVWYAFWNNGGSSPVGLAIPSAEPRVGGPPLGGVG